MDGLISDFLAVRWTRCTELRRLFSTDLGSFRSIHYAFRDTRYCIMRDFRIDTWDPNERIPIPDHTLDEAPVLTKETPQNFLPSMPPLYQ